MLVSHIKKEHSYLVILVPAFNTFVSENLDYAEIFLLVSLPFLVLLYHMYT